MKQILLLILCAFAWAVNDVLADGLKLFKPNHKYTIQIIHNLKTNEDYNPSGNGIGGENACITISENGEKLIINQTLSSMVFEGEGKMLSQKEQQAKCEYKILEVVEIQYDDGSEGELIKAQTSDGNDANIELTKVGTTVEDEKNIDLYAFRIRDGIFDDLLWAYTENGIECLRRDIENINGLQVAWSSKVSAEQKKIISRLIRNMVAVRGGSFNMGSTDSDAEENERPIHEVLLSDFLINKYPLTEKEFEVISGITLETHHGPDYPVTNISRNDCWDICEQLEALTGLKFTIPTEAQWEYAARGGDSYKYSGSDNLGNVGWYSDNSYDKLKPVGQKSPNRLGLYDMSGNVYEWCSDYYYPKYSTDSQKDPLIRVRQDEGFAPYAILRGGSYLNPANKCRVTRRDWAKPYTAEDNIGFRLVIFDIDKLNKIE